MRIRSFIPLVLLPSLSCEKPNDVTPEYPTYKHERPAWSNDGLTIAFRAEIDGVLGMYAVDSSGSNLRRIYTGDAIGFSWSPDSKWIVFSQSGNLYRIKYNGDSVVQITTSYRDLRPAWSRDGRRIATFRRSPEGGVYALKLDSMLLTRIDAQGNYPSWDNLNRVVTISWNYVAFDNRYVNYLTAFSVDSSESDLLSSFSSSQECSFPQIRSDGKEVAFVSFDGNNLPQIHLLNLSTQRIAQSTTDGGDAPSYSPDGNMIVYTRTAKGDGALWVMNADGSNKRRLTSP